MYLGILLLGLVVVLRLWFLLIDEMKLGYRIIKRYNKMEQIEISTKTNKEAIEVLESGELSARVSTSELYSMENVFSAYSWYCEDCGEHNESDLRSGCEIECEYCGSYCSDVDDNTYKLAELVYSEIVKRGKY